MDKFDSNVGSKWIRGYFLFLLYAVFLHEAENMDRFSDSVALKQGNLSVSVFYLPSVFLVSLRGSQSREQSGHYK